MKHNFKVTVTTNELDGSVMCVYLRIRKGASARTVEVKDGAAYADYNQKGQLLGIELLEPCSIKVVDKIAQKEDASVKRFVLDNSPRGMLVGA
jgi:uncharacterized protein YuzE